MLVPQISKNNLWQGRFDLALKKSINFDDPSHTFIIGEAGSNWKHGSYEQDLKRAKQLIKVAVKAGCDAVKFQTFRPESVYVQNAGQSNYLAKHGHVSNIQEIFAHLAMPYEMIPELAKFCNKNKIIFMSTPFSVEDAKHIDDFVDVHKIASYEINHIRLLEYLAQTKKPVLISTGASNFKKIDFAVNLMKKFKNHNLGLMQCTAKYPCPITAMNLSTIPHMKTRYNLPLGLSDHSQDPIIAPILAMGFGATFIEKHFTLDKSLPGPDHAFALNPSELETMVKAIRNADHAKGDGKKDVLPVEKELWRFATRSIQATKKIKKGDTLREGYNFDILRPGNRTRGLEPIFLKKVNGRKATKDYRIGEGITSYK